ncbi:hypothetical protein [Pedobacter agri]|uniref:hypothetical protein n=1 Tax=Pedobacter agri TaxID=454586 RepID=UPI00292FF57A|nr:hypothetical protein [Pedobacter agri]
MEDIDQLFEDKKAFHVLDAMFSIFKQVFGYYRNADGDLFYEERVTNKNNIKYLMHAKSGSMVLLYNIKEESIWDNAVVVESDSSGEPTAIVAKNLSDYLRLLHQGDGFISKVVTVAFLYKMAPDEYRTPLEAVNNLKINAIIEYTESSMTNFNDLKKYLNENGFFKLENPVQLVWESINLEYPITI